MESQPQTIGNYVLGQTLGTGTTGKVKLAERIDDKQKVAIKIIKKSLFDSSPDVQKKIRREIALMRFLDHPHLLKLEEFCESQRHLYIVLEYASNGELFDFLVTRRTLMTERALRFFRQIVYGLDYLHSHGFCHRDLKPENILLDAANQIKIGDFGFARWMRSNLAETSCGSPHYAAPEVIRGVRYDGRCADVWSAGVIFYALLSGKLPFDDSSVRNLLTKVKAGQYYMVESDPCIQDLLARMLTVDPAQRITIAEIKETRAFRLYSPEGYIFPTPIPLPYLPDPIPLESVNDAVMKILLQLGYQSEDDVKAELSATSHNMAKVFFSMLMNQVSLKKLPWEQIHNQQPHPIASEEFIVTPEQAYGSNMYQSGDPFRRMPRIPCVSSPETYSLVEKNVGWGKDDLSTLDPDMPAEEQDFTIEINIEQFMQIAEKVMTSFGFVYFHPDDVQLVAKKDNPETYILFNGLCSSDSQIDINMSRTMGTTEEFAAIIDTLRYEIQQIM